ncbi:hypothetical protein [Bacillus coahuilensis]|uniref:hypothetical protein n=1 Tax=Bacillus coahuilensis TaxID=408580 RepID=UPI000B340582|nr:hypothetical protein [Bacillus coahuilensis]
MEVRIVLNIMWVAIGIGVVTIIPTSLFFFQTLNVEMIQLISLLCLGYVPYTIFYKSIPRTMASPIVNRQLHCSHFNFLLPRSVYGSCCFLFCSVIWNVFS